MNRIIVALAQINATVGALEANARLIAARVRDAKKMGVRLVVFPELALSGYPPEDLVLKPHFLADVETWLAWLAREVPARLTVVLGAPRRLDGRTYNTAVVLQGGRETGCYRKMLLPNYGVFDEKRIFSAGDTPLALDIGPVRVGLNICEDSWIPGDAACAPYRESRCTALINLSASPYHRGKLGERERVLGATARALKIPLLYCNLVGGQDELVFDGASLCLDAGGQVRARAPQFAEKILYVELPDKKAAPALNIAPALDDLAEVYAALTLGLRDYAEKNGFQQAIVALSGGIDSALVATLAADALGADRVAGVTMPSQFTSDATLSDAQQLAQNLGIRLFTQPIGALFETFMGGLQPLWPGREPDTTEENLQARIRGVLVMALSNKFNWLVLTTGNKSEIATGYCTLYGDMAGGFAVIKDVPKTLVFALARWRNAQGKTPVIPPSTIERPPSAELRPNQKDSDSLPPYELLDPILERYVELDQGADEIIAAGFDPQTVRRVARLVDTSEYKRRQGAPGIKITPKAFGRDRRMPITNGYRE